MRRQSYRIVSLMVVMALGFLYACGEDREAPQSERNKRTTVSPDFNIPDEQVASLDGTDGSTTDEGNAIEYQKADFRILYAGDPGCDREKDFVRFLTRHFSEVKTADLSGLQDMQSSECDVLILDGNYDGIKIPKAKARPNLSRRFARSTLTIGAVGAIIGNDMELKTGFL